MGRFGDWLKSNKGAVIGSAFGPVGMLIGRSRDKKRKAEDAIAAQTQGIKEGISGMADYEIPEETKRNLELMEQTQAQLGESAEAVRGTVGLAEEATDIARARTGRTEMPGEALARRDLQQSTAGTVQNIMQAGGGAGALGAIAQAGLGEQSAFGQLAQQRAMMRDQASQGLSDALRSQAGMTAQAEAQAAGLEAQGAGMTSSGLMAMAGQKEKQFGYGRDKELTGLQFDIDQLGGMKAQEQARRDRNAQLLSAGIGAVGDIAGALIPA